MMVLATAPAVVAVVVLPVIVATVVMLVTAGGRRDLACAWRKGGPDLD